MANTYAQADDLIEKHKSNIVLILLDYRMPGLPPNEAFEKYLALSEPLNIKLALMSGQMHSDDSAHYIQRGAKGFFPKANSAKSLILGIELILDGETYIPTLNKDNDLNITLNERERKILRFLADGLTNKEIGSRIFVEEITVKGYISRLCVKFNAKNRTQLLSEAFKQHYI
ncbi:MAG: response regulator transcription factor [Pseudomonadota bacterium]